ncbi:superoxide dismutase family protein [Nannocystis pusilla]|uniref:superoxide dismutase family protein n=1 Tax=Nannocystis pusilla TaxID=889268 RepID=UPI003DA35266
MTRLALSLAALPLLLGAPGCTPDEDPSPDATATLTALMSSGVNGTVNFTQLTEGKIRVEAEITGLSPGKHGMHVHEWGDCTSPDGESAGSHFNPDMTDHGMPGTGTHHPGDFGNLDADAFWHRQADAHHGPGPLLDRRRRLQRPRPRDHRPREARRLRPADRQRRRAPGLRHHPVDHRRHRADQEPQPSGRVSPRAAVGAPPAPARALAPISSDMS